MLFFLSFLCIEKTLIIINIKSVAELPSYFAKKQIGESVEN
jgi:hypothetical protein